jgi:hypothetical protein
MFNAQGIDSHCRGLAIGSRRSRKGAAMRGTPHQYDLAHGKGEGTGAALRHIPESQRAPARIPARRRFAINAHRTGERRQQAEDRLEQCRFAFAVSSEHAQHLTRSDGEIDMLSNRAPRIAVAQILH